MADPPAAGGAGVRLEPLGDRALQGAARGLRVAPEVPAVAPARLPPVELALCRGAWLRVTTDQFLEPRFWNT